MTFRARLATMSASSSGSLLRSLAPALLSSLACAAFLVIVVVVSENQGSTPQLELLQGKARVEQLVGLDGAKARRWETEAESAAERAYRLEKERRQAKLQAANLQSQEQHWLQKAQSARERAEALRSGGGHSANRLQEEKEALKRRLARNEQEMQMVEHMERQPAPWRGQPAEAPPAARGDPKIAQLESELHHQINAYRQAREAAQQHDRSRSEAAEERQLEQQIAHFRTARERLDDKMQGQGFAPMPHNKPVKYRSEPRVAHPRRPKGTILGTAEKALGDSVMPTSDISSAKKGSRGSRLPGVNAYSWWSNKPAQIKAEKEMQQLRQPKEKKENCHNLYSCVGSLFGGSHKSKLSEANKKWQEEKEREEERLRHESGRALVAHAARPASPSADVTVSVKDVERDPQAPLLGALDGATETHDNKLPGVAENRWGGTKFWERLLGGPQQPKKQLK